MTSSEQSYLALAEHVPQVDNLGSYDMAVTPGLIVHGILAFTTLAFKLQGIACLMTASPFLFESKSGKSRYTRLFACISEEEDCYTVQVRLSNGTKPEDSAWGEEIADSFETASELVAALAGEFSIVQTCIKIEIRMHNHKDGTRH